MCGWQGCSRLSTTQHIQDQRDLAKQIQTQAQVLPCQAECSELVFPTGRNNRPGDIKSIDNGYAFTGREWVFVK